VYKEKVRTSATDIALRRIVFTAIGQLNPRILLLLNLSGSGNSGEGSFQPGLNLGVLDAYGEYKVSDAFYVGAGLHQWTGFSRLNADGVGSLLNLDQPAFQQISWNKIDKLGRFLGIYAKGDIGRFNYRVSVNEAFVAPQTSFAANTGKGSPAGGTLQSASGNAQLNVAYMNPAAVSKIFQGYVECAFWDKETHITPYETSTYQGSKKIFNIGAGFFYRRKGMLTPTSITLRDVTSAEGPDNPMLLSAARETGIVAFAVDAIVMYPFSHQLDGVTVYAGYFHTGMGPNYYTLSNVLNTTRASAEASVINGSGNAYPGTGTGNTYYVQGGYITPKNLLYTTRIGVFATYQYSRFEALKDAVQVYEGGLNCYLSSSRFKLTAMYRNRPVYTGTAAFADQPSEAVLTARKGEVIAQFQLNF
jgi:hypothetical protein